jgi:hypothetical protein
MYLRDGILKRRTDLPGDSCQKKEWWNPSLKLCLLRLLRPLRKAGNNSNHPKTNSGLTIHNEF